jgi:hypothetical protein
MKKTMSLAIFHISARTSGRLGAVSRAESDCCVKLSVLSELM